jgi:undecaprenyl-diphosphatase
MLVSETIPIAAVLVALLTVLLLALGLFGRWFVAHRATLWRWADVAWQRMRTSTLVQWLAQRFPRWWRFVGQRLSPESYLGLHLTVGIVLSLLALGLFGEIAENVVGRDDLTRFDVDLADKLHRTATPAGVTLFKTITWLGSFPVMLVIGLAIGIFLLQRGQRRILAGWVIGLAGGSLLNLALKAMFHRPRPQFDVPITLANGWSFPSGHAMGSLIGYGLLAYIMLRFVRRHWLRMVVLVGMPALVLLIGFSRLYLGVHYFSDVVGGYAAGAVWLSACVSGLETVRRRGYHNRPDWAAETPGMDANDERTLPTTSAKDYP